MSEERNVSGSEDLRNGETGLGAAGDGAAGTTPAGGAAGTTGAAGGDAGTGTSGELGGTGPAPDLDAGEPAEPEAVFRVSGATLAYRYGLICLLTLVAAAVLYLVLPSYISSRDYIVLVILGCWVLALLRYWFYMLDMPYRVVCGKDRSLQFVSTLRKVTLPASSIVSLKVSPLYSSYIKLRTDDKKTLTVMNHVDGLNELVARIREDNPRLTTRGC